jgi:GNAT superfamily N-acetyltransferase
MHCGVHFYLRPIEGSDNVKRFSAGADYQPLKSFLRNQAQVFHAKAIAKTYVACKQPGCDDENLARFSDDEVIGYVTLTCSEICLEKTFEIKDAPHANSYEALPAVKLARLAIDSRCRRSGIGGDLVNLALTIAADSIQPLVGCRFLITDAKKDAVSFYERHGFTLLNTQENLSSETPVMFIDLLHTSGEDAHEIIDQDAVSQKVDAFVQSMEVAAIEQIVSDHAVSNEAQAAPSGAVGPGTQ